MRPPLAPSPFYPAKVRRWAGLLMYSGLMYLTLWLATCVYNFYWGARTILLTVHTGGLKFSAVHGYLFTNISSPVGDYNTGTQGSLLYTASSLSDYVLFHSVGGLTSLDALFVAGLGVYLYWSVRRLPSGHEFTPAASRAIDVIGLASTFMFMLKMMFHLVASQVFKAKAQGLFYLDDNNISASVLYVVFGLLLGFCAEFFRRGQQLQQENELTI